MKKLVTQFFHRVTQEKMALRPLFLGIKKSG